MTTLSMAMKEVYNEGDLPKLKKWKIVKPLAMPEEFCFLHLYDYESDDDWHIWDHDKAELKCRRLTEVYESERFYIRWKKTISLNRVCMDCYEIHVNRDILKVLQQISKHLDYQLDAHDGGYNYDHSQWIDHLQRAMLRMLPNMKDSKRIEKAVKYLAEAFVDR